MSKPMLEAEERQTEWALSEISRQCPAPDLSDKILAKLHDPGITARASKEAIDDAATLTSPLEPSAHWRWTSALAVAGGLLIVAGVAWSLRPADGEEARQTPSVCDVRGTNRGAAQDPKKQNTTTPRGRRLPPPYLVQCLDDIQRLPKDARNVRAVNISDAELPALAKARGIERLDLTRTGQTDALTDDGLRHLAGLSKMRELVLDRQDGITGTGIASLANLPVLQSLSLRAVRVSKTALAPLAKKLSALRKLDLEFSSMNDSILGVVVEMQGLKWLSLRGCSQLTRRGLAQLQNLKQLEHLDLGELDSVRGLAQNRSVLVPVARWGKGDSRFKGVVDDLIDCLPSTLRSLVLTQSLTLTDKGLTRISEQCPRLIAIDISGCVKLTDEGVAKFLASLELRRLNISLTRLTEQILDDLTAEKTLEELQVRLPWVTGDTAAQLKEALPKLHRLEMRSKRDPAGINGALEALNRRIGDLRRAKGKYRRRR